MSGIKFAPAFAVMQRYGGVSASWLWRREHDGSGFPRPIRIGGRKFYDVAALDAYDAAAAAEVAVPSTEGARA
jgi:hypothetical protein